MIISTPNIASSSIVDNAALQGKQYQCQFLGASAGVPISNYINNPTASGKLVVILGFVGYVTVAVQILTGYSNAAVAGTAQAPISSANPAVAGVAVCYSTTSGTYGITKPAGAFFGLVNTNFNLPQSSIVVPAGWSYIIQSQTGNSVFDGFMIWAEI
jgi:hypothetical protein